jgi:hypothetical protein
MLRWRGRFHKAADALRRIVGEASRFALFRTEQTETVRLRRCALRELRIRYVQRT